MAGLTTTQLAEQLGVSKGRVSQYVKAGQLDGCFEGDGRARRFDLGKAAKALGRNLDAGQMMGNGAATKRTVKALSRGDDVPAPRPADQRPSDLLDPQDPDRYEMARTAKAEEEARRLRRQNAEAEGQFVLASEAARQTKRIIAQEIAQFETMLRDAARKVADELGVDYRETRQILIATWRQHRGQRSEALSQQAEQAEPTDEETAEDF